MKLITTLTRMWLTRRLKPFEFTCKYDNKLSFSDCENLGLYIHIPFCKKLCDFCPYCKEVYTEEKSNKYIDYLIKEIHMVGSQISEKKQVTSLYFGGGTPALVAKRLNEIISAIDEHFIITESIGLELHPENVNEETLLLIKEAGVTKISIGIQSFQKKFLSILGRNVPDLAKMSEAIKKVPFETVSMDFIFALPKQTIDDLESDIDAAFSSGANHIAIYPFIDFTFTDSSVQAMGKKEKRTLLDEITRYCQTKGYTRDSIWTFSNNEKAKYSSMTRDNFLGFGCSATTLLKDQFKVNTFSVEEYQKRIEKYELPTSLTIHFTKRQRMIYYLFWTAYS
ncbi:MAG: radical SAM protein, partial [Proteocatella sp.]